jgi:hypothetical protein
MANAATRANAKPSFVNHSRLTDMALTSCVRLPVFGGMERLTVLHRPRSSPSAMGLAGTPITVGPGLRFDKSLKLATTPDVCAGLSHLGQRCETGSCCSPRRDGVSRPAADCARALRGGSAVRIDRRPPPSRAAAPVEGRETHMLAESPHSSTGVATSRRSGSPSSWPSLAFPLPFRSCRFF